jgi:hypothetical protein
MWGFSGAAEEVCQELLSKKVGTDNEGKHL